MSIPTLSASRVAAYRARTQHLHPDARGADPVEITRHIAALHSTDPTCPYLSLWARARCDPRPALEDALYERHSLVRAIGMRRTLHVVPSDELPYYDAACGAQHRKRAQREGETLLVQAGLCDKAGAPAQLSAIRQRVLETVAAAGAPVTVRALGEAIPDLQASVRYGIGTSYEGSYSVGSRLVPALCDLGLLVRARPQGTWRSNLHQYALLSDWLPGIDLAATSPEAARCWTVERYLAAFGPATTADVRWWTGLPARQVDRALRTLQPLAVRVEGLEGEHWLLPDDLEPLRAAPKPEAPYAFLLPGLDPYIMGYTDRGRMLDPARQQDVFDRAGNAMPTAWVDGRVVGVWAQHADGRVVYGLFEEVSEEARRLLDCEAHRLEAWLDGERLQPRTHTRFTRALASGSAG